MYNKQVFNIYLEIHSDYLRDISFTYVCFSSNGEKRVILVN